jgi:hypothetical protein
MLGYPGKGRKEGEDGVQPSDMTEGTRGAAAAWGRGSERVRRRGVERRVSGEKGQREREGVHGPRLEHVGRPRRRKKMGRARRNRRVFNFFK